MIEFSGFPNDQQFAEYIEKVESVQSDRSDLSARNAVLIDTSDSTRPVTAAQRRMQVAYMKRAKGRDRTDSASKTGLCFVITNTFVRGVLTALLWMSPINSETMKIVGDREDADEWCRRWVLGLEEESHDLSELDAE